KTPEPDDDYIVPLGVARTVQRADDACLSTGSAVVVITYGMGVYWALEAATHFPGQLSILDLRTLFPLDWPAIATAVRAHNRVLILTEAPLLNSFAEALAGRISK